MNKLVENLPTKQLYKDVLQPGMKKVGEALGTVLDVSNLVLLPVKLANAKARLWFDKNMEKYQKKLDASEGETISVPEYVGLPILDKLTMLNDDYLSEAFINLLTKASYESTLGLAHPAFLNVLNNLSSDEAKLLFELKDRNRIPYIEIKLKFFGNDFKSEYFKKQDKDDSLLPFSMLEKTVFNYLTGLEKKCTLSFPGFINIYWENLERNGIIQFDGKLTLLDEEETYNRLITETYSSIFEESKQELDKLNKDIPDQLHAKIHTIKSFFEFTEFGKAFVKACMIDINGSKNL